MRGTWFGLPKKPHMTIPTASIPALMTKRSYFIASSPVGSKGCTNESTSACDRTSRFYHRPSQGRAAHGAGEPTHLSRSILIPPSAARNRNPERLRGVSVRWKGGKFDEWFDLSDRLDRGHHGAPVTPRTTLMTISEDVDVIVPGEELAMAEDSDSRYLSWTAVILGALVAAALSSILLTFGATIGLGLSSAAPTWRDASAALWLASGLYLIIQALVSFGVGGYIAGRTSPAVVPLDPEETE